MSALWSRIGVALILLPLVLGLVWLGGWWLFGLAAVGGLIALHELYTIALVEGHPITRLMPSHAPVCIRFIA